MRSPWRAASFQNRRLQLIIIIDRGWRAAFEGGHARGAQGFAGHQPDGASATLAVRKGALAPHVLEECALFWAFGVPKAEIILVDHSHLTAPVGGRCQGKGGGRLLIRETVAAAQTICENAFNPCRLVLLHIHAGRAITTKV